MEYHATWKDTFNLAVKPRKKVKSSVVILIVLAVLAVLALAKFAFLDRFAALGAMELVLAAKQQELDDLTQQIREIEEVTEDYAHYTDAEMTEEELTLVERTEIIRMINQRIRPHAKILSWTLDKNVLNVQIDRTELEKVNKIVTELNQEELVDYAYMKNADGDNEELQPGKEVNANLTVTFSLPVEELPEEEDAFQLPENYFPMRLGDGGDSQEYYFEMAASGEVLHYYHMTLGEDNVPTWTEISENEAYKGIEKEERA